MGKTYFNMSDSLNFNGKAIKIKANATEPLEQEERSGRAIFPVNMQSQIYQSVLASQPQVSSAQTDNGISIETSLSFLNSSAQVGRINIVETNSNGYSVNTDVALNKVTTGALNLGSAKTVELEWLVVSGLQAEGFKYQFVETALHDIDVLIESGTEPSNITWVVFVHDYVYEDYDEMHFKKTAVTLGIKIQLIEDKNQFINYINIKSKSGYSKQREKTKICYLSVYAHGQTPLFTGGTETRLSIGYHLNQSEENEKNVDWEVKINFLQSDISSIDGNAFHNKMVTNFFTCNTGTADANGERFAQIWVNKTGGETYAFQNARSNYIFINSTMDQINLAFNFPGSKDIAVSDIINKMREVNHEWFDVPTTEVLTAVLGKDNRDTADYIAKKIVGYSVSKEWEIKQERKADRERIDEQGKRYGYADKGSLQFPMLNNILDDMDIISKTWREERGFLKFAAQGAGGR